MVCTQRGEKEAETKAEAVAALLPDHMIADRCQGQRRKVACRSGRAQGKVRMSKETAREREDREDRQRSQCRERQEKTEGTKKQTKAK